MRLRIPNTVDPDVRQAFRLIAEALKGIDWGGSVPADGNVGYPARGIFQLRSGGANTLYANDGDITACDFNPVTTS